MKICYIADARSPIAQNWIRFFVERGHEVHIISTYPTASDTISGARIYPVLLGFSNLVGDLKAASVTAGKTATGNKSRMRPLIGMGVKRGVEFLIRRRTRQQIIRSWLIPLELQRHVKRTRHFLELLSPDLIHAMRIPYEGILATLAAPSKVPLIVSVWGNDFTLFARQYPLISWRTRQVMRRTDGLHPDCYRDLKLGFQWGFDKDKPSVVLPGGGGIDTGIFSPSDNRYKIRAALDIPDDTTVIINPRGFRGYVHNDVFFKAVPAIVATNPKVLFLGLGMEANPTARRWVKRLNLDGYVRLLPKVEHYEMARLFQASDISVSLASHDGTPNTLLEAMACGCFPVAGDIESIREWITHGDNGLLCNPRSAQSVSSSLIQAINSGQLREHASEKNRQLIAERATYMTVMAQANQFYEEVLNFAVHRAPV